MPNIDCIVDAIGEALDENTTPDVVAALSGALVALLEDQVKRAGHDPSKTIVINGGEHNRKIVIRPLGEDN